MTHPLEPLVDYALGSLEAQEVVQLEAHLATCAECRAEVNRLRSTLSLLAEELEPVAPPSGTWDRVQSRLRPQRRTLPLRWVLPAAAGFLLTATAAFGTAWWRSQNALREARASQAIIHQWMSWGDVRFVPLATKNGSVKGRVLLRPDGRALIVMPEAAPAGQVYQAWGLYKRDRSAPAESLAISDRAVFEVQMRPYPWFWLSLEPSGGSRVPSKGIGWSQVDGG